MGVLYLTTNARYEIKISPSQDELVKISKLCALDWELEKADTKYRTHGFTSLMALTSSRRPSNIQPSVFCYNTYSLRTVAKVDPSSLFLFCNY